MNLPKPTTDQLMRELTYWPLGEAVPVVHMSALAWQQENVPWEWSPAEFEQQTKMLMANDCPAREMLAWLVHGVRWNRDREKERKLDYWSKLNHFGETKGAYLRAWADGANGLMVNKGIEKTCGKLDWHPEWKGLNFAQVVEDFCWARELRLNPQKINASKKPLSPLGSIELFKVTTDYDIRYGCFSVIAKDTEWGPGGFGARGTDELLAWPSFNKMSPFTQRAFLSVAAQAGPPRSLEPAVIERIHAIWGSDIQKPEQVWWKQKSRTLVFDNDAGMSLLEQHVHPLQLNTATDQGN